MKSLRMSKVYSFIHFLSQALHWVPRLPQQVRENWTLLIELTGEGNGTPLQYSCLENPMDGGAWWAAVHGVAKSQARLSDFTFTFYFHALEKEMATHSSVLAWRFPRTEEAAIYGVTQSQTQLKRLSKLTHFTGLYGIWQLLFQVSKSINPVSVFCYLFLFRFGVSCLPCNFNFLM